MTVDPNFDRTWEYRFYDERGLITLDRFPQGVGVSYGADADAWRAAELFEREHGVAVNRIERDEAGHRTVEGRAEAVAVDQGTPPPLKQGAGCCHTRRLVAPEGTLCATSQVGVRASGHTAPHDYLPRARSRVHRLR